MFRFITLFCIVIAAVLSPVRAQDGLPMPLRTEDILTDAVTVVDELPLWHFDNVSLSIYDEAAEEWQRYVLPVASQGGSPTVQMNADGTYRVTVCSPTPFMPYYGANDCIWQFDPTTGEFAEIETICGSFSTASEGLVPYVDPVTYESHFCDLSTGELSAPLPIDLDVLATTGVPFTTMSIPVSDGMNASGNLMIISVYGRLEVFDLITGETMPLGEMDGSIYSHGGVDWIDDTHALFIVLPGQATTPRPYNIYLVDMTQPSNAQLLHSGEGITIPNNYYSERVLQWVESDCSFSALSFDTLEVTSFTIPGVCGQGTPLEDGSGDWLLVQDHRVLRYNLETRSVQMLFMDGIGCYDASPAPGGRYQVLYFTTTEQCNELAVMDTQSGSIDYLTPHAYSETRARWIDGDTLLIYETPDNTDRLVHMATGEEIFLPRVLSYDGGVVDPFSNDGRYVLVQPEAGSIGVYDVTTNSTTLIAHDVAAYELSLGWQDDNILSMWFTDADDVPLGRWRVQLRGA